MTRFVPAKRLGWLCLVWLLLPPFAHAHHSSHSPQTVLLSLPGAVFREQINAQQEKWRNLDSASLWANPERKEDIIFTDRYRNPISEQEFIREIQRHHAEIYSNQAQEDTLTAPFIEPPPPQDALLP